MYSVFMGKTLLPVTPSKIKTKVNNNNKMVTLLDEGEVNIVKKVGLTDISMDVILPNQKYPYARYLNGFKRAKVYLDLFERLKNNKEPFQLIISRSLPKGSKLFYTNIKVTIEDYEIDDDAKNGFDITVKLKLKQYKEYGTKSVVIKQKSKNSKVVKKNGTRPKGSEPQKGTTYKVKYGDTLWGIAKRYYGDGSKYHKIYNSNKKKIEDDAKKHGFASSSNGNRIWPNLVLTIPI